ncbi:MAG TPA: glycosyltransferase [Blastocatellia bacterium]|jgi:cellulose synthase/poly-beta-1,6-N-acetylglucosamine synthase-like glycosyltransferase|nr:glycosyltransferase [Blastocatellia bacterium]
MTKLFKPALLAIACLIVSGGTARAGAQGSIQGNILDLQGRGGAWVIVSARDGNSGKQYQAKSDADGAFVFESLEPGRYLLSTEYPGIEPAWSAVQVEAGRVARAEMVTVPLRVTGNDSVDKFVASSSAQGGGYPAGNISYLNVNDTLDLYLMWIYFSILGLLSVYGVYRYRMVYLFLRYKDHNPKPKSAFAPNRLPRVTVQLPLFNEMYVAERLIDAVVKLDYPRELLEIQVLDDSTDATTEIASRIVARYFDEGHDIVYHHRSNREGFKAGALEAGLKKSSGEFVLIFDADFVPRPDCIYKMIDYFTDDRVGMVQMRWSHINSEYSLLTKVQAIMLDAHFTIEQTARNRCGGFFNFNGTAGMWRREAIEWSGGWQHDTLAEDTDLSYRAQLMGWHFVYLADDDVPSELPVEMNAFKSQQKRWAKGVVQVGLKMFKRIWHDPRLPFQIKLEQFFRLTGNLAAPLVIVLALINLPILIVRYNQGFFHLFVLDVPILTFSTLSVVAFYVVSQRHLHPTTWKSTLKYLPIVMSMGIALTFSNARAVLEAIFRVKSPFVRTPKYRIEAASDTTWVKKSYVPRRIKVPVLEMLFTVYFIFTVWYAIETRIFGTIPFLMIYLFGYAYATVMSIAQSGLNVRRDQKIKR